ncbi:MAG TPA: hypothetical protein VII46_05365 [Acidimicrobiales bacterium]
MADQEQAVDGTAARVALWRTISCDTPEELLAQAREVGFKDAQHVAGTVLAERYFADRTDGFRPSSGEEVLVATT